MSRFLKVVGKWRRKPRARIAWTGLQARALTVYSLIAFGMIYGGFDALFGFDGQGNRWLGFAALVGGCVLLTLGVMHLMRPIRRRHDVQAEGGQGR